MDKPYYKSLFNRCLFIDEDYNIDTNFIRLAKKQHKLTFDMIYLDPNFRQSGTILTPFKEIKLYDNFFVPDASLSISQAFTYQDLLKYILNTYKNVLRRIDPKKKYLCSCSAWSDSRILCALLAQLRDEEGYNWDNIIFHCWGRPESESFLELMKRVRFKNLSILDDTVDDAFDVGTDEIPVNFYPYDGQMKFWGKYNQSEYTLISTAEGEAFQYSFASWIHRCGYFSNRGEQINILSNMFNDAFFPLLSKDMISIVLSIPDKFKGIKDVRINRDKLRTDLCELLGVVDIPMPKSYYNFNLSYDRKKLMIYLYEKSKFKKDYNINLNFDKVFKYCNTFEAKVWGFAVTVYERIFG